MKPYLLEAFTNELGDIIQPGDKVLIITSGYNHKVNRRVGVYLGCRKEKHYNTVQTAVVVEYKTKVHGKWNKDGKQLHWSHPDFSGFKYEYRMVMRRSTLQNTGY
jgi:hypothetical protein